MGSSKITLTNLFFRVLNISLFWISKVSAVAEWFICIHIYQKNTSLNLNHHWYTRTVSVLLGPCKNVSLIEEVNLNSKLPSVSHSWTWSWLIPLIKHTILPVRPVCRIWTGKPSLFRVLSELPKCHRIFFFVVHWICGFLATTVLSYVFFK